MANVLAVLHDNCDLQHNAGCGTEVKGELVIWLQTRPPETDTLRFALL
jgi:hypothetical protein